MTAAATETETETETAIETVTRVVGGAATEVTTIETGEEGTGANGLHARWPLRRTMPQNATLRRCTSQGARFGSWRCRSWRWAGAEHIR